MVDMLKPPMWHKHDKVPHAFFYTDELGNIVCAIRGTKEGWRLIYRKDGQDTHEMMQADSLRSALIEATSQIERVRNILKQERIVNSQLMMLRDTVGNA